MHNIIKSYNMNHLKEQKVGDDLSACALALKVV